MVDSRKRVVKQPGALDTRWCDATLIRPIAQALSALPERPTQIAVALSGGADSAMLALHAAAYARSANIVLHCLHIHHGLQAPASGWRDHVHDLAHKLGLPCHSHRVQVDLGAGKGMEAAARDARYQAFSVMAQQIGVQYILLGHHRDDQAETVILRLLRGSGPTGLAAMAPLSHRLGNSYVRPWLDVDRARILQQAKVFQQATGWAPVHDPTNHSDDYTRGAVRERLTPALNERWPGWQAALTRHARQSAQASSVLDEVAASDFSGLEPNDDAQSFSLALWRLLTPARQALVLRWWLAQAGLGMPSDAKLQELMRQLRGLHALGHDRQLTMLHAGVQICCVRGRVALMANHPIMAKNIQG
ncbi:tRNA lysidine(34) synthetase TilS [Alcaligenaceae bacterium]|nr:tRNA lysidine(34) synthetase TilS [Alcaligenaceae bacterium]